MAVAWREKWAKKAHFCGGLSVGDVPSPLYCKGKHMFRPVCSPSSHQCARGHFPVSDTGVTAAFYKVRDFSVEMCIRIPAAPRSIFPPHRHVPHDPFSLELLSSYHPRSCIRSRSRCVSIPILCRGFARCL